MITNDVYQAPTRNHARAMALLCCRQCGIAVRDIYYEYAVAGYWSAMAYNDDMRWPLNLCRDGNWR